MEVSLDGTNILLGALAGTITGVLGSLVAAFVQITGKRLRNARLIRRGEPPIKDVMFRPLWLLFGILGAIAGASWTWRLDGTWITGAIAGAGMPALATLIFLGVLLRQLRR